MLASACLNQASCKNDFLCTLCMYCKPSSKWNKLYKRFQLNPTNPAVAQRRQIINNSWSGLSRWTRWRDLGWEVHGKELIIFVVRDFTDSLLCVFPCSNNSCLCLWVDRWQVMMVFPSLFLIVYCFLLLFVELPFHAVFPDLNLPLRLVHRK